MQDDPRMVRENTHIRGAADINYKSAVTPRRVFESFTYKHQHQNDTGGNTS